MATEVTFNGKSSFVIDNFVDNQVNKLNSGLKTAAASRAGDTIEEGSRPYIPVQNGKTLRSLNKVAYVNLVTVSTIDRIGTYGIRSEYQNSKIAKNAKKYLWLSRGYEDVEDQVASIMLSYWMSTEPDLFTGERGSVAVL